MGREQRRHKPQDLGPRIEFRGRWASADLRPWNGKRYTTLRDPKHPRWPHGGERTEDEDIARRWSWKYVDLLQDDRRRRVLGQRRATERLAEAAARFLEERERDVARKKVAFNTFKTNRTAVNHLLSHLPGGAVVGDIETKALQSLFDELLDDEYKIATLHSYRFSLVVFFEFFGMLKDNPARDVELPGIPDADARAWTDDEMERLRTAAEQIGPTTRLAIELGLSTGCREQELFALRWEDFQYRERTVRVQRQLVHHSTDTKGLKGKRSRTALFLPDLEPFFHQAEESGLIITKPDGSPIGTQAQRDMMDKLLLQSGLKEPGVRWHACRHTYARQFIEMGGRFEELQKSLGHSSISVTEQTYGHFHSDRAASAARQRIYRDSPLQVVA